MTEQEILKLQDANGNREFYLMLIGKFLHAYGHGAFALARATGYRDGSSVYVAGSYWSSTVYGTNNASGVGFSSSFLFSPGSNDRYGGRSVRLVREVTP